MEKLRQELPRAWSPEGCVRFNRDHLLWALKHNPKVYYDLQEIVAGIDAWIKDQQIRDWEGQPLDEGDDEHCDRDGVLAFAVSRFLGEPRYISQKTKQP
jgi:hypothetical protein